MSITLPTPNVDIPSQFVMDCLATESEGDGQLFAALLKDKVLYAQSNGQWYIWGGHHWIADDINAVTGMVRYVTDRYNDEIKNFEEKIKTSEQTNTPEEHDFFSKAWRSQIKKIASNVSKIRNPNGRKACIDFARTNFENPLTIVGNEFDTNPWILGVKNGVVDLKSGLLYPGKPDDMVHKSCSCDYLGIEDDVDLDEWQSFVNTIYDNDTEIIEFVQRLLGYGLTGLSIEHVFPFFIGFGRNGKSLLMESVMRVMGSYAAAIPSDLFLKTNAPRNASNADAAVMILEGLRLGVASELEEGSTLAGAQIKKFTGGDTITGREPYGKKMRSWRPTHLIVMIGNHEPNPPIGDKAFWDRAYLIRHDIRFVKKKPVGKKERQADPDIEKKLLNLDSQILSWLVIGCLKWQEHGLNPPASVLKATDEYQDDADYIKRFRDACCTTDNPQAVTGSTELYTAFKIWYQETINDKKQFTPSQNIFGRKLKALDQFPPAPSNGIMKYKGIALNPAWYGRMMETALETR